MDSPAATSSKSVSTAGQARFVWISWFASLVCLLFQGDCSAVRVISASTRLLRGGDAVDLRRARLIPGASILAGPVGGPVIPAAVGEEDIPSLVPQTVVAGQEGSAGIQAKEVGHRGQHVQAGGHLVNLGGR